MGRTPEGLALEGGYKSPSITHLWPRHKSMARMVALGLGMEDIRMATGFTAAHVSRIMGSPMFQVEVERLSAQVEDNLITDVRKDLQDMAVRAVQVLDEDLNLHVDGDLKARKLRQNAAFDVLDRNGIGKHSDAPKELHLHQHLEKHVHGMSDEELAEDVMDILIEED